MPDSPAKLGVDFHLWIPIIAGILLIIAYAAYYRTTPQVTGRSKVLLVSLRTAVFLLLTLILLNPIYVRMVDSEEPAKVIALIDHSASMALPAKGWDDNTATRSRFETARDLAGQLEQVVKDGGGVYQKVYFSSQLLTAGAPDDTVGPNGQGTDVMEALQDTYRKHEGEHVSAVFLFSDGVETEERLTRKPVPEVPVYAVGVGDTVPPEDVRIKDVDYNSVVRVPTVSPIKASLYYTGRREKRVSLQLTENGKTIFARDTLLSPAASEIIVEIPVRYREAGRREFRLSVDVQGEDVEKDNNVRDIIVEAEKAKATILIVDLQPEWELHFMTDLLRRDQTFDFTVFTMPGRQRPGIGSIKNPDQFVSSITDCDAVVLISATEAFYSTEVVRALKRFVRQRGGGLLVLPGNGSLFELPRAWKNLSEILPVSGNPPFRWNMQYTSVLPGAQAGVNPITTHLLPLFSQTDWQERSPLLGFYSSVTPKPVSDVLLNVQGRAFPAMTYQTVGKGRTAAVSAGPLWRWKSLSENNAVYREIVSRMMEVLSRGEETNRFIVAAKKNVFDAGENPVFFAELFNDKLQPVTGVPVRLEIARIDQNRVETPLDLISMGRESAQNTRFRSELSPLPPGRYLIRGQAELADRSITSRPLEIRISKTSVEYQHVQQDRAFLSSIARRSGGAYASGGGMLNLAGRVDLEPRVVRSVSETTLRTNFLLFAGIILLLSAEWMIRKRAGMI